MFSIVASPIYIPKSLLGLPFSIILPTLVPVVFEDSCSKGLGVISHCGLDLSFLQGKSWES